MVLFYTKSEKHTSPFDTILTLCFPLALFLTNLPKHWCFFLSVIVIFSSVFSLSLSLFQAKNGKQGVLGPVSESGSSFFSNSEIYREREAGKFSICLEFSRGDVIIFLSNAVGICRNRGGNRFPSQRIFMERKSILVRHGKNGEGGSAWTSGRSVLKRCTRRLR